MSIYVGEKMKVINGIGSYDKSASMSTGDIVTVRAVYPRVVLVERPYHGGTSEMMRECFQLRNIHKYLRRVI